MLPQTSNQKTLVKNTHRMLTILISTQIRELSSAINHSNAFGSIPDNQRKTLNCIRFGFLR